MFWPLAVYTMSDSCVCTCVCVSECFFGLQGKKSFYSVTALQYYVSLCLLVNIFLTFNFLLYLVVCFPFSSLITCVLPLMEIFPVYLLMFLFLTYSNSLHPLLYLISSISYWPVLEKYYRYFIVLKKAFYTQNPDYFIWRINIQRI